MEEIRTTTIYGGLTVVGNIWCVGAGEPSSCPVRLTNPSFAKQRCLLNYRDVVPCGAAGVV